MESFCERPLHRAQEKCEELERELKKSPDFHLYLLTKSRKDRKRMERVLMTIPTFRLWRALKTTVVRPRSSHLPISISRSGAGAAMVGAHRVVPFANAQLHRRGPD
jgi:hypothetical protein